MMKMKIMVPSMLALMVVFAGASHMAVADSQKAKEWIESEFQPSTLTMDEQVAEMDWFVNAAEPFKGMEINVLSETIPTHEYESKVLTKAFEEITGIKVNHQLLGEGEVVQAVQTQMQTNRNLYDAYINDSDLIGTHSRLQLAVNLTDWMAGDGADVRCRPLMLMISWAKTLQPVQTVNSISFPTSNSQICTGFEMIGSTARSFKVSSRKSMDTIWVFQSIGPLMKILLNSSRFM